MMRPISSRLFQEFRRQDGLVFKGNLSSTTVLSGDKTGFRIMRVRSPVFVKAGDLVANGSTLMLLMDHPHDNEQVACFRVAHISEKYAWKRQTKVYDGVTKMPKDTGQQDLGFVYANLEVPRASSLDNLIQMEYRFLTGQDVKVGDLVGDKMVKSVAKLFGVNLAVAA